MDDIVGLVAILCFFAIPFSGIWSSHHRKMLEIKMRTQTGDDASVRAAVEALRAEVRSLRETTLQYDISFDSALQRLESRVDRVESRGVSGEAEKVAMLSGGR